MNDTQQHALDGHQQLAQRATAAKLWIDGTSTEEGDTHDDGTFDGIFTGDAAQGPWVVLDIDQQKNITGPFDDAQHARDALAAILDERSHAAQT